MLAPRPPRRSRKLLVSVSLVAHVVLVVALFVAGSWHLERLELGKQVVDLRTQPDPPPAQGGKLVAVANIQLTPKHKAEQLRQPKIVPPETPAQPEVAPQPQTDTDGTGNGTGPGEGSGSGSGSGSGTTPGSCETPPCGEPHEAPPPVPDPPKKPKLVAPVVLKSLRLSGETQIEPPDSVKIAMTRDGAHRSTASFTVCLGTAGEISSVGMTHSSGYALYDQKLASGIRSWRYQPYRVDGQPIPVCSVVTFIYAIE